MWRLARTGASTLLILATVVFAGLIRTESSTPVAGNGPLGYGVTAGLPLLRELCSPTGLLLVRTAAYLSADHNNHRIRRVDPNGIINTVAGNGTLVSIDAVTAVLRPQRKLSYP